MTATSVPVALERSLIDTVTGPIDWATVLLKPGGACDPRRFHHGETRAVCAWLDVMRNELEPPVTSGDIAILGSIGRVSLIELRLARSVAVHGITDTAGHPKQTAAELRAYVRLKADLIGKLRFRRGAAEVSLADYLDASSTTTTDDHAMEDQHVADAP